MIERNLILKFKNGKESIIRLNRGASVDTPKKFINLEQTDNGYWRVVWSKSLFPEFGDIVSIEIERKGESNGR